MCSENHVNTCATDPNEKSPNTLMEAVKHFSDLDVCHRYVSAIKWPGGEVVCPKCGGIDVGEIKSRRMYQCKTKECRKQFSAKVGTIFEDSPLGLDKWLVAVWSIVNAKNGISSCELARAIGVTQKSAWHMLHRIRLAMKTESYKQITGEVEADDCHIGGKSIFMHKNRRNRVMTTIDHKGKTIVHGVMERGGEVRVDVVNGRNATEAQKHVRQWVKPGSLLYTDIASAYRNMKYEYLHQTVNHALRYVDGRVHTNSMENFWSLLKRALKGTYVRVSPAHLQRYLDEQCRRFNLRKLNDAGRFNTAILGIVGRRLTYKELIGEEEAASA